MSKIQLRNTQGSGTYQLIIDGVDVSREVLRDVRLEMPKDPDGHPVLTVRFAVDQADIDLDDVEVERG